MRHRQTCACTHTHKKKKKCRAIYLHHSTWCVFNLHVEKEETNAHRQTHIKHTHPHKIQTLQVMANSKSKLALMIDSEWSRGRPSGG